MAATPTTLIAVDARPGVPIERCCVLDEVLDEAAAVQLAAQLKALADPARLRLVSLMATAPDGEVCACDLPEAIGKSQPTTSHHLRQLVDAGLIEREQRGRWAWFRLDQSALAAIRTALGATDANC